jgi:hypothetical protein
METTILELGTAAAAITAIIALCAWIAKPVRKIIDLLSSHSEALKAVLKNSITRAHREFTAKGEIGRFALQSVIDMHTQYKALGGNGFVDEIVEEIKELPVAIGENKKS